MVIDEAKTADFTAIRAQLRLGLEEEYGPLADFGALWDRYAASEPRTVLVARDAQQVIGFVWLVQGDDPLTGVIFDYVFYLAVDPAFRGRGIGKSLLAHCQSRGRPLRLMTRRDHPALSLYPQLGFSVRAQEWEWQA